MQRITSPGNNNENDNNNDNNKLIGTTPPSNKRKFHEIIGTTPPSKKRKLNETIELKNRYLQLKRRIELQDKAIRQVKLQHKMILEYLLQLNQNELQLLYLLKGYKKDTFTLNINCQFNNN